MVTTTIADRYAGQDYDPSGPESAGEAVTPDDAVDLTVYSKRLWVGGAGDVALITVEGVALTYKAVPAGSYLSVRAKRVKATGTTATSMLALW